MCTEWFSSHKLLVIFMLGILSFIIPLLLSLKCDLGTKLSKGEVRKSIVISLTVMYIILLSLSFAGTADMPATNVTYYNRTIIDSTSNTTTFENSTFKTIPATVNIIQNFLYVYVVIIGFYFGSRLGERIKMLKELKNLKPLDILQKRYAMGEIDDKVFGDTKSELEELERDEKKESEYQREVKFLQGLVNNGKLSYNDYGSKLKALKQQEGRNNHKNEKK